MTPTQSYELKLTLVSTALARYLKGALDLERQGSSLFLYTIDTSRELLTAIAAAPRPDEPDAETVLAQHRAECPHCGGSGLTLDRGPLDQRRLEANGQQRLLPGEGPDHD